MSTKSVKSKKFYRIHNDLDKVPIAISTQLSPSGGEIITISRETFLAAKKAAADELKMKDYGVSV
ncbi:MAG: hypothetical protein OXF20_12805 [Gammaproteobacteria bacterium]|nr:hypothetical protein [Gammaproteobacteria bacterium]